MHLVGFSFIILTSLLFIYKESNIILQHVPKSGCVYRSARAVCCLYFFSVKLEDELYKTATLPVTLCGCECRSASGGWNTLMGKLIGPTLHELKCERDTYTICYIFRHFLSAVMRQILYQLKCCPSNWPAM
jgi:hypothetical protein